MRRFLTLTISLLMILICFGTLGCSSDIVVPNDSGMKGETSKSSVIISDANLKIIYNVNLSMEVKDVEAFKDKLATEVESVGGWTESTRFYTGDNDYMTFRCTVRIPTAKLNDFLASVQDGKKVESISSYATNITTEYASAEARLLALNEQKSAYDALLSDASITAQDKVEVITLKAGVEAEIQTIKIQLENYDSLVDYSSVGIYASNDRVDISSIVWTVIFSLFFIALIVALVVVSIKYSRLRKKDENKEIKF